MLCSPVTIKLPLHSYMALYHHTRCAHIILPTQPLTFHFVGNFQTPDLPWHSGMHCKAKGGVGRKNCSHYFHGCSFSSLLQPLPCSVSDSLVLFSFSTFGSTGFGSTCFESITLSSTTNCSLILCNDHETHKTCCSIDTV